LRHFFISGGVLLAVLTGVASPPAGAASPIEQIGPLYQHFPMTLAPATRTEALGPLFIHEQGETHSLWSIPPLFSYLEDPATESREVDFLYPLLTYDRYGSEYRFQILQLFSFSGGQTQTNGAKDHFYLFPLFFRQWSTNREDCYTAIVPIYGHIKNRLLRDDIFFVLFPLYAETWKRDIHTRNYVYPFFHLRSGNALTGWQFWPLIGHEHKELTTRTNNLDEVEVVGGHDKRFVLWPFYLRQDSGIGTTNVQHESALLPLYSMLRSPGRDSTTYLWPFFTFTEDREKKYREKGLPWPFIVFARGEGKTANRVWPFYSRAYNETIETGWVMWPVYKYNHAVSAPLDSDLVERNTATGAALHRVDFWPFFTARTGLDGNRRLQILALLEPFIPNNKSVERNFSQLWSLWRSEANAGTGARSQSLLWNLYRHESAEGVKKCSLLFGLFQYESSPARTGWRLFFLPVHRSKPVTQPQTQSNAN
jgi:hypothetical protein